MEPGVNGSNGATETRDLVEARALEATYRQLTTDILLARSKWARQSGITFDGARDEYAVLGYPPIITTGDYRAEYARGGLAGRIVDVMPDATWRGNPAFELVEDEDPEKDTPFEAAWDELEKKHQIGSKLLRVDKLSRLSTYAVLLIGAPGTLDTELPRGASLLYLMPFSGGGGPNTMSGARTLTTATDLADATIAEFDTDPRSARFGLPAFYSLKRVGFNANEMRKVHWTRVLHVAEGLLDDEVYGQPALERVWNLLCDLRKVTGGGSESFWLRANQGLHIDVDKDLSLPDAKDTIEALKQQAEDYKHQLTRWLRTRGVKVETLGSDVANFGPNADAIITQIAGAKGIPKRILTGSEMGELASSQDRENFKDIVNGRQTQYAGPYIVRPLIDRLIEYGYLPTPTAPEGYEVDWPHIQTMTAQEKADGASKWMATNQAAKNAGLGPVFTESETRDHWEGFAPLTDEQKQEIEDQKRANMQLAQEMAPPQPAAPTPVPAKPLFGRAAEDEEIIRVLAEAIEAGNTDVVHQIVGLGGPGSGNFGHEGRPGAIGGSGEGGGESEKGDSLSIPKNPDVPHGTVVAKSKYGTITATRQDPSQPARFVAHRKNGETVGTRNSTHAAADLLRSPKEAEAQSFPSGHRFPDVVWNWSLKGLGS